MTALSDTSADVTAKLAAIYRGQSPREKWRHLLSDYQFARQLHAAGFQRRHPAADRAGILRDWIGQVASLPAATEIPPMNAIENDYLPVLKHTVQTLDRLGIAYAVGGSIASTLHGIGRTTRDADILVEPFANRLAEFIAAFPAPAYYLSEDAVRAALKEPACFNILHLATGYKIDIFVRSESEFESMALSRRAAYPMPDSPAESLMLSTPEDIVLFKLRWYRLGGEVSERQWTDILGVLGVQGERFDNDYVNEWSAKIGVGDLWMKVRQEA